MRQITPGTVGTPPVWVSDPDGVMEPRSSLNVNRTNVPTATIAPATDLPAVFASAPVAVIDPPSSWESSRVADNAPDTVTEPLSPFDVAFAGWPAGAVEPNAALRVDRTSAPAAVIEPDNA